MKLPRFYAYYKSVLFLQVGSFVYFLFLSSYSFEFQSSAQKAQ